jgi:hypothetical protein
VEGPLAFLEEAHDRTGLAGKPQVEVLHTNCCEDPVGLADLAEKAFLVLHGKAP